jgi:hypothetical protein
MMAAAITLMTNLLAKSDHDILIEVSTKMDMVYLVLTNHLEHHFIYTVSAVGFAGTTLLLAIKLFMNNRKLKRGDK